MLEYLDSISFKLLRKVIPIDNKYLSYLPRVRIPHFNSKAYPSIFDIQIVDGVLIYNYHHVFLKCIVKIVAVRADGNGDVYCLGVDGKERDAIGIITTVGYDSSKYFIQDLMVRLM